MQQREELNLMEALREISARNGGILKMSTKLHGNVDDLMNIDRYTPQDFRRKLKIELFKKLLVENAAV